MKELRVHFEGDGALKPGFRPFFDEIVAAARCRRIRLQFISGGATAGRDFLNSLKSHPAELNVLLIDSEGPFSERQLPASVAAAGDLVGRVFWMVQLMESWFLADPDALERYYGQRFERGRLRSAGDVESIAKDDVLTSLKDATRNTGKGTYHKTRDAPKLLGLIDSNRVRRRAQHCDEIFSVLLGRLET